MHARSTEFHNPLYYVCVCISSKFTRVAFCSVQLLKTWEYSLPEFYREGFVVFSQLGVGRYGAQVSGRVVLKGGMRNEK